MDQKDGYCSRSVSIFPFYASQKKEKSDSERFLTEQLQAKELELLQLRTEMETSQGTGRTCRPFYSDDEIEMSVLQEQHIVFHLQRI